MAPFKRRRRSSMFFGASSKSVPQPTWAQCKIGGRCNQVQPLSLQIFPRTPRLQTLEPHVPVTSGVVFFGQTWQSLSRRTHYSRHCTLESMGHRSRKRNNGFFTNHPPTLCATAITEAFPVITGHQAPVELQPLGSQREGASGAIFIAMR